MFWRNIGLQYKKERQKEHVREITMASKEESA
jgi:hypothetical protein